MFSRRLSLLSLAGFLLAQVCSGGLIRRDIIGYDDRDALFDRWDKSTVSKLLASDEGDAFCALENPRSKSS